MAKRKPKQPKQWRFAAVMPSKGAPGPWIGVRVTEVHAKPKAVTYPVQIKLRYAENGVLLCAGLRIGADAGTWRGDDEVNITSRWLGSFPLGRLLKFLQELDDPEFIEPLTMGLAIEPEGRTLVPGAKRRDAFYIHQAEVFVRHWRTLANDRAYGDRVKEAYGRVATETHWRDSTVRAQVRRGWELRPDLKPEGIRTRRTTKKGES